MTYIINMVVTNCNGNASCIAMTIFIVFQMRRNSNSVCCTIKTTLITDSMIFYNRYIATFKIYNPYLFIYGFVPNLCFFGSGFGSRRLICFRSRRFRTFGSSWLRSFRSGRLWTFGSSIIV